MRFSRNLDRAGRRWLPAVAATEVSGSGPIRTEDGEISNNPLDDEFFPQVSRGDPLAHSNSPFLDWGRGDNADERRVDRSGNPISRKRVGATPDAPFALTPEGFGGGGTTKWRPAGR